VQQTHHLITILPLSAVLLFGSVYLYPWLLILNSIGLQILSAAPTANNTHNVNLGWRNKMQKRRANGNKVTLAIMTFSSYLLGI
jgi:hypothetical protein